MMRPISLLAFCLLLSPAYTQTNLKTTLEHVVSELKTPDEFGLQILPAEAQLIDFNLQDKELNILLNLSLDFLYSQMDDEILDEIVEHFIAELSSQELEVETTPLFDHLVIKAQNEAGNFRELSDFLAQNPIAIAPTIQNEDPGLATKGVPVIDTYSDVQPRGQLGGKTVWLSAGHGWIYDSRVQSFKTQRHNHFGVVEDFSNIEAINYHLLKYLYNAGTNVWSVRERDMNTNEVIVDNDQGAPAYREFGRWATSSTPGRNNETYRYTISRKTETATAVFTPEIPESGMYWVSVFYQNGYNRSVDTRYRINHAGGESHITINQEVHGNTWVYLGQFYFEKGSQGSVVISNESRETSQAVVADAVRFGGGVGDLGDCYHGKKSGEPRYEEGARYYAQYQGYPDCVGDISIRPKYAEWELAKGTKEEQDNAIYLSWHSNASGAQGTESFVHRYNRRLGSRDLQKAIQKQVVRDIRYGYDPNWKDRGQKVADFGELRGLQTMPGVLLEIGFHDNRSDAAAITDPKFRNLVARATYKGIVRYFAQRDKRHPVFLPEPPTHLVAQNKGTGKIELNWNTPEYGGILGDRATTYKVYRSQHGKAFAAGIETRGTSFTFNDLLPGVTYYFRITALNEGGESFPTAVVAVRTPVAPEQQAEYLIVDGFDRLDHGLAILQKETVPRYAPLGNTRRLFIEQMNNYDYAAEHASAMSSVGLAFDGATNEAVVSGAVNLEDYFGVNWFLGRESSEDQTLSPKEQQLISRFLDGGGVLIISGSELAFDLAKKGNGKSFYRDYLKADFVSDDAGYAQFAGFRGEHLDGMNGYLNNKTYGAYPLRSPDIIRPVNGARTLLEYRNGKPAAVAYRGDFAVVNFGFPLEAIGDERLRNELFKKSITYLDPIRKAEPGIAGIEHRFSRKLTLDLNKATEGQASFNLFDALGKAVFRKKWKHNGRGTKTFYLSDLPDGIYTFEFDINGQKQTGRVLKE